MVSDRNLAFVLVAVLADGLALSAELNSEVINSAEPSKKSLSKDKATPAGVRLQVLLARAHGGRSAGHLRLYDHGEGRGRSIP